MSDTSPGKTRRYFVRWQGQVTGPFDVDALRASVGHGTLTRFHEVSEDRKRWVEASRIEALFPPQDDEQPPKRPLKRSPGQSSGDNAADGEDATARGEGYEIGLLDDGMDDLEAMGIKPSAAPTRKQDQSILPPPTPDERIASTPFVARKAGAASAPPEPARESIDDAVAVVTEEFDESVTPLHDVLGGSGNAAPANSANAGGQADWMAQAAAAQWKAVSSANRAPMLETFSFLAGIAAAAVIFIILLLPHTRVQGSLQWFWGVTGAGSATAMGLSLFLLVVAIGLVAAAWIARDYDRALAYLGIFAGATLALSLVVIASMPRGLAVFAGAAPAGACVALLAMAAARAFDPKESVVQRFAARVAVVTLVLVIVAVAVISVMTFVPVKEMFQRKAIGGIIGAGLVAMGYVASVIAAAKVLAAGSGSLDRKRFKQQWVTAAIALLLMVTGGVMLCFAGTAGAFEAEEARRFAVLQLVRVIGVYLALMLPLAAGLLEASDVAAGSAAIDRARAEGDDRPQYQTASNGAVVMDDHARGDTHGPPGANAALMNEVFGDASSPRDAPRPGDAPPSGDVPDVFGVHGSSPNRAGDGAPRQG